MDILFGHTQLSLTKSGNISVLTEADSHNEGHSRDTDSQAPCLSLYLITNMNTTRSATAFVERVTKQTLLGEMISWSAAAHKTARKQTCKCHCSVVGR